VRRVVVPAAAVLLVLLLARVDGVAAGVAGCGFLAVWALIRLRSPSGPRRAAVGLVTGATAVAVVAALGLPTYRKAAPPLVVLHDRGVRASATPGPPPTESAAAAPLAVAGQFEALGFVTSDNEDSWAGVDRDAGRLSTLAATGISVGSNPGSIDVSPATDGLVRAHLHGALGLAVVSNYNGRAFDGRRAQAMLSSADARRRFVSALTGEVARRGWDGVVLDFEDLPAAARRTYPLLVSALDAALGRRPLTVAVPATGDGSALEAYDLKALGAIADRVVWMAYDQHDPTSAAGPVAALPWVRSSLAFAERSIPREKLLLGVAGYGYAWTAPGHGADLTVPQAQALGASSGATSAWDETAAEVSVKTADGRQVWYDDARSVSARASLAASEGLAGVALWRVGAEDPGSLDTLPPIAKQAVAGPVGRKLEEVHASGLVALTFDDGPDPVWTPRILDVLRREHVPGTFFVIGKEAQAHPELLREEIRSGDVIGNHTYSHPDLNTSPAWRTKAEILGAQAVIEGITGRKPTMFRSPYGGGDHAARGPGSDQLAADLGLHAVSWNVDSGDWLRPGPGIITTRVTHAPPSRAVVLLHDGGGDRAQTLAALPQIIHTLRDSGYLFTTADALDGGVTSPYQVRADVVSQGRGIAIVAGFRLMLALRRVGLWFLLVVIFASLARIALSALLAGGHWWRRRGDIPVGNVDSSLSMTVVIPAHNEERVISKTLSAVNQLRRQPLEVIVVDDGSTDRTAEIARYFGVTVLSQRRAGKATALNAAISRARGDIVVILDADTVLRPDFADVVLAHFADPGVGAVAGNVKVGNRQRLLGRLQAIEYISSLNLDRRAQAALNVVSVVPGAAGAFRHAALIDVGGYPPDTLVEDMDLTVTLLRAGWRIPYEPAAVAFTEAPQHTRDVIRQRRRWSYGTLQVVAKHGDALLDPKAGRVGLIGLPWLLVCQVLLPLAGPLIDLYLLYLLFAGEWASAAAVAGAAIAIDLAVVAMGVFMDKEPKRYILLAIPLRVLWRPLQLVSVALSVHRWLHGRADSWRRVPRYNTVPTLAPKLAGLET
jgi:peptidoglycan/xylan/chitin deacetylase (PgdA/CDA1 family)/spore germination protein YaaH/GT2 family glycosyltransferase